MISLKCNVRNCPENHSSHYCKTCRNNNSDHFSRNCPQSQGKNSKCNVRDCTENHSSHYCKTCRNNNSDHFSRNCPQSQGNQNRCEIQGCMRNHSHHYCRLCNDKYSNHLAENCPKGIVLYHATRISSVSSIAENGLAASTSGRIGPGIYFTTEEAAMNIAKNRNTGTGVAVFRCVVNLGNCYDNGNQNDNAGSWQHNYDSCTSIHPPWAGNLNFREWCLKDPKKIKILALYLLDGEIQGDLRVPYVFQSENCKVHGKITAKKLLTHVKF